jgi:hypothetical protein
MSARPGDEFRSLQLPDRPELAPAPLVVERVRTLAHEVLRGGVPLRRPILARGGDAFLSVAVAGLAVVYVGWAVRFASALYH